MSQRYSKQSGIPKVSFPSLSDDHEEIELTSINRTGTGIPNISAPANNDPVEYSHDYFSGSTTRVFFDNIWVDDVVTIQWTATQQKAPIYGYASQFFNAVSNGNFIVQGSFSIAFKEVGYLYTILNTIKSGRRDQNIATLINEARRDHSRLSRLTESSPAHGRFGETKEEYFTIENWLGGDYEGSSQFENVASALEDILWGTKESDILDPNIPYAQIRERNRIPRPDELDRVDNPFEVGRIGRGFDIVITYGDMNDGPQNYTVKVLSDIHLTGNSQSIAPTGEPVAEVYSFFGRSIDDRKRV